MRHRFTALLGVAWLAAQPTADATPHRRYGELGAWLAGVRVQRLAACEAAEPSPLAPPGACRAGAAPSPPQPAPDASPAAPPCLEATLRLFVAPGAAARARALALDAGGLRPAREQRREQCAVDGAAAALLEHVVGGPAARPGGAAGWHLGVSRPLRLDSRLLVRARQIFGDQLRPLFSALRARLRRHAREAPQVAQRAAALLLLADLRGAPHYRVRTGVLLPERVELRIVELARAFKHRRGRQLLITSGTRTALGQAQAMYTKLTVGGRTRGLYRKQRAAASVEREYRRGRAGRLPRDAIVDAMRAEIERQIAHGVHLSPHLLAGAFDVRSRTLSRRDRGVLLRLARSMPWICKVKLERRPPHFHMRVAGGAADPCEAGEDLPAALMR